MGIRKNTFLKKTVAVILASACVLSVAGCAGAGFDADPAQWELLDASGYEDKLREDIFAAETEDRAENRRTWRMKTL